MIRGLHPGNHRRLIAVVTNIIVLLGVVSDCDNNESDCAESVPDCASAPTPRLVEWPTGPTSPEDAADPRWTKAIVGRDCDAIARLPETLAPYEALYVALANACRGALESAGPDAWEKAKDLLSDAGTLPNDAACQERAAHHLLVGLISAYEFDPKSIVVVDAPSDIDPCAFALRPYAPTPPPSDSSPP